MTRDEHMAWCKERALAYLPGDATGALASMLIDLSKHDETKKHAGIVMTVMLQMSGHLSSAHDVRKHIEGFN